MILNKTQKYNRHIASMHVTSNKNQGQYENKQQATENSLENQTES